VSGLTAVTNSVLEAIFSGSGGCPHLRRLTLRACAFLGDDGVLAVMTATRARGERVLEWLDLSGCLLVSHQAVQTLCTHFEQDLEGKEVGGAKSFKIFAKKNFIILLKNF
jgi:hypothetical protein